MNICIDCICAYKEAFILKKAVENHKDWLIALFYKEIRRLRSSTFCLLLGEWLLFIRA